MIRKDQKTTKDGRIKTHIRVVEGYRPGPGLPPKQRTIQSFGYLEDQDDPDAFMESVKEFDQHHRKGGVPLHMELPSTAKMYQESNRLQNYGVQFLAALYDSLHLDSWFRRKQKKSSFKGEYSPGDIFQFLVLQRILHPDSKRATCQGKNNLYGLPTDFTLPDLYRSLDFFAHHETDLQHHLHQHVKTLVGRDLSYAFYDVTNVYFSTDVPDDEGKLRQRGVSKEHRVDPIVEMGLFMDAQGFPIHMALFPGNTSESLTLHPMMQDVKKSYGMGRLIVVADKGIHTSKNREEIRNQGDGYVFSQILRGRKGARYRERLLDASAYQENREGTYRYQLFTEEYMGTDAQGHSVPRQQKVLLYWSQADALRTQQKREEKLRRAQKHVHNPVYGTAKGASEYTREDVLDAHTGEVISKVKKIRHVDYQKAEEDALLDGYSCLVTSELDYDAHKIREVYHELWKIEESFRIVKSDLYVRPVYVWKQEHIRAHFLICFTALLIIRLLQYRMGSQALSAQRIARALNAANCRVLKNGIVHLLDVGGSIAFQKRRNSKGEEVDTLAYSHEDEIALDYKAIQESFGSHFYDMYPRQEQFNQFLKSLRRA